LVLGDVKNSLQANAVVQDIHDTNIRVVPPNENLLIKTHWKCDPRMPLAKDTIGAICVVRNPLDVIVSHLNYFRISDAETQEIFVKEFASPTGLNQWVENQYGSWQNHAYSWFLADLPFPVLKLKYEVMLAKPIKAGKAVAKFLEFQNSISDIKKAVKNSSFNNMKKIEQKEKETGFEGAFHKDHREKGEDYQFMNTGTSGNYRNHLSGGQIEHILKQLGPAMESLGYTVDDFAP